MAAKYTRSGTYGNALFSSRSLRRKDVHLKVCPVCGTEYGDEAAFCSRDRSPLRTAGGPEPAGLIGQLVGERYQVERRIGEGGMGEVYLARHVLIGRACALKVMSPLLSRDPDAVTRFNREATSASRITHPNVCTVYDFGLTGDGLVYLAMEFVDGRTLRALLDETGPLPLARAADLLAQCAAGLAAAHELGLVHRDLKPDNIMVVSTGAGDVAKLVDFGIAKAVETPLGERVTKSGFVVGTPEYMSPEQLAGDPVDASSDQYALALVFYRMLTGRLPFEGGSLQETLTKRLTDPPRPIAEVLPDASFPPGLQDILDRALSRHAGQRFASVHELADAVTTLVRGSTGPTRRLGAASHGEVPPTRQAGAPPSRRTNIGVIALGLVVIVAGAWGVAKLTGGTARPAPDTTGGAAAFTPSPVDSTHPAPAAPPVAPSPAPVPPLATVAADTGDLDLRALDSLPARRAREIARAEQQLAMSRLSARRRAAAAAFLGTAALDQHNRDSALVLYRLAYGLDPNPGYLKTIRRLGDTIQP